MKQEIGITYQEIENRDYISGTWKQGTTYQKIWKQKRGFTYQKNRVTGNRIYISGNWEIGNKVYILVNKEIGYKVCIPGNRLHISEIVYISGIYISEIVLGNRGLHIRNCVMT